MVAGSVLSGACAGLHALHQPLSLSRCPAGRPARRRYYASQQRRAGPSWFKWLGLFQQQAGNRAETGKFLVGSGEAGTGGGGSEGFPCCARGCSSFCQVLSSNKRLTRCCLVRLAPGCGLRGRQPCCGAARPPACLPALRADEQLADGGRKGPRLKAAVRSSIAASKLSDMVQGVQVGASSCGGMCAARPSLSKRMSGKV